MPSMLERTAFRYGMPLMSAAVITVVGFTVFSGLTRLLVLGIAVVEIVAVPQVLKRAAREQSAGAERP